MKKRILTVAVAALALAACSKNETVEVAKTSEIGFTGAGINNITRATDITSTNFSEFYVYGGYNASPIFNGQQVTGGPSSWTYSPTQYWVLNETYKFGAYAPKADGIAASWTHAGGLVLDVNSNNASQNDLVYAAASDISYTDINSVQPVALTFKHLLSKVKFTLKKDATSLDGVKLEVSDFKLTGSMVMGATWTAGTIAADEATMADYAAFGTFTEVPNSTESTNYIDHEFYMIPQTVGTWEITFAAKVTDNAGTLLKEGTVTASLPKTPIASWTEGNAYDYTATIAMDNIDDPDVPDEEVKPIEFTGSKADNWNYGTEGSNDQTITLQ